MQFKEIPKFPVFLDSPGLCIYMDGPSCAPESGARLG